MAYENEMELEEELGGFGEFEQQEGEWEQQGLTHEFEGDQFFGRIKRFVQKRAPFLKNLARLAAPVVGTAIGGPFGAILGRAASSALGEEEFEQQGLAHEYEHPELAQEFEQQEFEQPELAQEFEQQEFEQPELAQEFEQQELEQPESSQGAAYEIAHHEVTHHEALAEIMAEAAAQEHNQAQAEAMIGAAVVTVLSPRDRRALSRLIPHLVRGGAVLTRPAVRVVPTIMRRTVARLKRQAAAGKPVTRGAAGRAAAVEVRRVLGSPSACAAAIRQNVQSVGRSRANGRTRY
jgi:hypothetical protein